MENIQPSPTDSQFKTIQRFLDTFRCGDMDADGMYLLCLRAALMKSFEFASYAALPGQKIPSFICVSSLRGICEDIIVLNFLSSMLSEDRENLVGMLTMHELQESLACQIRFFKNNRRHQQVIGQNRVSASERSKRISDLQAAWLAAGFRLSGTTVMPQVRLLAEKRGRVNLYDFIYKLTSKLVHFNPQVLLRSGWSDDPKKPKFSFSNFEKYYDEVAKTYGLLLLCLYFELFGVQIQPDKDALDAVGELRSRLMHTARWPELVTWEEMNLDPPPSRSSIMDLIYMSVLNTSSIGLLDSDNDAFQRSENADGQGGN